MASRFLKKNLRIQELYVKGILYLQHLREGNPSLADSIK